MEPLKTTISSQAQASLFGGGVVEFGGRKFVSNETRGYFTFKLSHTLPVANAYGTGLLPRVVALSHESLRHQNLNLAHQIAAYHPDKPWMNDRVVGCVLDVEFPSEPVGGWKVPSDRASDDTPCITGLACIYKQTQGMIRLLGRHMAGRHDYSVSMEVFWHFEEAGFAVHRNGGESLFPDTTPEMLAVAGWDYCPVTAAPDELLATFSKKKNVVIGSYRKRPTVVLMGGLDKTVSYAGVGIVEYGAERTAEILRMAASAPIARPLRALVGALGKALNPNKHRATAAAPAA
jgi:hypothetical protein